MPPDLRIDAVDVTAPDAQWALREYLEELDRRFPSGFPVEESLDDAPGSFSPPVGLFLVARVSSLQGGDEDGAAPVAGCGGLLHLDPTTSEIKRMWVNPDVRGRGVAGALLARLEAEVLAAGRRRVVLDTNGTLTEAISMYHRNGYRPIERYNDNPYAEHWFEKHLA